MMTIRTRRALQTVLYVAVGVATSVAVLIAVAFSLLVLVPALSQLTAASVDDSLDSRVLSAVSFSKYADNETLSLIHISEPTRPY